MALLRMGQLGPILHYFLHVVLYVAILSHGTLLCRYPYSFQFSHRPLTPFFLLPPLYRPCVQAQLFSVQTYLSSLSLEPLMAKWMGEQGTDGFLLDHSVQLHLCLEGADTVDICALQGFPWYRRPHSSCYAGLMTSWPNRPTGICPGRAYGQFVPAYIQRN